MLRSLMMLGGLAAVKGQGSVEFMVPVGEDASAPNVVLSYPIEFPYVPLGGIPLVLNNPQPDCSYVVCLNRFAPLPNDTAVRADDQGFCSDSGQANNRVDADRPTLNLFPKRGLHYLSVLSTSPQCREPWAMTVGESKCADGFAGVNCDVAESSLSFIEPERETPQLEIAADGVTYATKLFRATSSNPRKLTVDFVFDEDTVDGTMEVLVHSSTWPIENPSQQQGGSNFIYADHIIDVRGGRAVLDLPSPRYLPADQPAGAYYIAFLNRDTAPHTVEWTVTEENCQGNSQGSNCQFQVAELDISQNYQVNTGKEWWIGSIDASRITDGFQLGVKSLEAPEAPEVYIRFGQGPSDNQFDLRHVSTTAAGARFYSTDGLKGGADSKWYVAVRQTDNSKGGFGVWFQGECPADCSGNGVCQNNVCTCDEGYWSGFDCLLTVVPIQNDLVEGYDNMLIAWAGAGFFVFGIVITVFYTVVYAGKAPPPKRVKQRSGYQKMGAEGNAPLLSKTYSVNGDFD